MATIAVVLNTTIDPAGIVAVVNVVPFCLLVIDVVVVLGIIVVRDAVLSVQYPSVHVTDCDPLPTNTASQSTITCAVLAIHTVIFSDAVGFSTVKLLL